MILFSITVPMAITSTHFSTLCILRYRRKYMFLERFIGIPLFSYLAEIGIGIPAASRDMGVPMADRIFPVFGVQLILGTIFLVVIAATIVSFLPARKIAKMNPVDALKGKLQ